MAVGVTPGAEGHESQRDETTSGFNSAKILSKLTRSPSTKQHNPAPSLSNSNLTVASNTSTESDSQISIAQHSKRNHTTRLGGGGGGGAPLPRQAIEVAQVDPQGREQFLTGALNENGAAGNHATTGAVSSTGNLTNSNSNSSSHLKAPSTTSTSSAKIMTSAPLVSDVYPPHLAPQGSPNTSFLFQQMQELTNKRIATLDYMRKSHEGRTFWFNTVQFTKFDISRLQSYTPNRLSRRASNYLLLGLSIPAVLDVHPPAHPNNPPQSNVNLALDYLRSLNTLLVEFESFQQLHPIDGSHAGALARARIPQMFRRATTTGRARKSTGGNQQQSITVDTGGGGGGQFSPPAVPETPLSAHPTLPTGDPGTQTQNVPPVPLMPQSMNFSTSAAFPPPGSSDAANSSLLPNEGPYTHLLTPPLPFAPDFYAVFATLCDVLIDAYRRLLQIVSGPGICTATVAEMFSKTDAKIRKVMVGGIVREFESSARDTAKRELAGVQKVVLGGLIGV